MTRNVRPPPVVLIIGAGLGQKPLPLERLEESGYQVLDRRAQPDALAIVGEVRPDVILVDVMPSATDALSMCRLLQSDPETQKIPLIAIAGEPLAGQVMMTVRVHACTPENLQLEIARVLNSKTASAG